MLLTIAQVAERMDRTPKTVRRWIREAGLPARRHPGSGDLFVKPADLEAWCNGTEPCNISPQDETVEATA